MSRLDLSQPTLYRAVKAQPEKAIALGGRRNRKVAALRSPKGMSAETSVFMVDPEGDIQSVGRIFTFHPTGLAFLPDSNLTSPRFYSVLPAFLLDSHPQGFLGRAFARKHADLSLPADPKTWNTDDILSALSRRGEDLPGNILVGEESFKRLQELRANQPEPLAEENLADTYLAAASADSTGPSLVGGAHPKFTALVEGRHGPRNVVVKFSPAGKDLESTRCRDLLLCEWLALECLRDAGISTADTRFLEVGGRIFLESERYDRDGALGRKRVLSFAALGALPPGPKSTWASMATQLLRDHKIAPEDLESIGKLECFARMIGHTSRRPEDLAFLWAAGESQASLAPMVGINPSHFARPPGSDGAARELPVPICDPALLGIWKRSIPIALNFWDSVLDEPRISAEFQEIARAARLSVSSLS